MSHRDHYRPFTARDHRSVIAGLKSVLRRRGAAIRTTQGHRHDGFRAVLGGEGGLEVSVNLGRRRIPRLDRVILMQTEFPAFYDRETAPWAVCFCDNANEAIYGSKFYLRAADGDPSRLQIVVERACLVGDGDLFRLADEFDLLVVEYFMAEEQLVQQTPAEMDFPLPSQLAMFDKPVAENC